ncbi:MAG TPA: cytochrome c3 family protein [Deferrisomatales bacterium]|nr:cytochrome c3 family protein [Deferrisomatales bacterium]
MKKLILIATAVLFALSVGVAFAADMPAGDSVIDAGDGKKGAVTFSHTKHKDNKCDVCHHAVKGEATNKKCNSCHTLDGGDGPKLKDAMHGKDPAGACYTCHLMKDAANKLKCAQCHGGSD